jgi:tetratricopeptide (TPR) repeat protein
MEAGLVSADTIAFVERAGLAGRLYNDMEVGSYLTWRWWPQHRVFQDPRINGYPEELHAVLRRADLSRDDWQRLLDGFQVEAAMISYPSVNPRGALFDPARWALVHRSSEGLVFVRRGHQATLVAAHEQPLTFRYGSDAGLTPVPLGEPPRGSTVSACEWSRRLADVQLERGDDSAGRAALEAALADERCLTGEARTQARRALGTVALRLGDPAAAAAALEGLPDVVARTNHALARLALGHPAEALETLEAALADEPDNPETTFGVGLALEALDRRTEAAEALRRFLVRAPAHVLVPAARERLRRLGAPEALPRRR